MSSKLGLSMDLGLAATPQNIGLGETLNTSAVFAEFQQHASAIIKLASVLDAYTGRSASTAVSGLEAALTTTLTLRYIDTIYAVAAVNIPAGAACYTRLVGGVRTAYLAQATMTTTPDTFCTGFCASPVGVLAGSTVAINVGGGLVPTIGGLSEGQTYYLSETTAGVITPNKPTASGSVFVQPLGYALGPTSLYFIPCVPQE